MRWTRFEARLPPQGRLGSHRPGVARQPASSTDRSARASRPARRRGRSLLAAPSAITSNSASAAWLPVPSSHSAPPVRRAANRSWRPTRVSPASARRRRPRRPEGRRGAHAGGCRLPRRHRARTEIRPATGRRSASLRQTARRSPHRARVRRPERIQGRESVRGEHHARTGLPEDGRLFQHRDPPPRPAERDGRSEAADPATRDEGRPRDAGTGRIASGPPVRAERDIAPLPFGVSMQQQYPEQSSPSWLNSIRCRGAAAFMTEAVAPARPSGRGLPWVTGALAGLSLAGRPAAAPSASAGRPRRRRRAHHPAPGRGTPRAPDTRRRPARPARPSARAAGAH